ncbi:hypothetical protein MXC99_15620 [Thauera aromatica]|uniref:hypothetical protein n=1 Tax=Thauera aromatica TaxID=59405 RepID=UPI001FFCD237|nr:hypothetical protein [Thauera aromatica]MCK2089602.1 hypothetical protein [Thauera aromatica]
MKQARSLHFILSAIITLLTLAALWLVVVASLAGRPHAYNQWVEQAYAYKIAAANTIEGPRVVIVAGSSAMFGIDSGLLSRALGRPTVNLGVNAGVLAPFIIDRARQILRPGDWVILPLEYPLYHDEGVINRQFIDFYATHPLPISEIGWWRWLQLIWQLPLERVLEGYRGLPPGFHVAGLYGPQNLDARGDQINSETAHRTDAMKAAVEQSTPEQYGARALRGGASWARWRALARHIETMGGCAIFVPPAMLYRPSYRNNAIERDYYETLPEVARSNGLSYAGEPFDFMYEEEAFFDTNFHLTAERRVEHTNRLATTVSDAIGQSCMRND